ncbi:MAG: C40 family peptidase, partial [Bacteroidota bacterium]
ITTEIASTLLYRKSMVNIVMGSIVPLSSGELFKVEEQLAFNGEAKVLSQRRDGECICTIASRFLNVPERPGGRTPFGMDADGWIRLVCRIAGFPMGIVPINQAGKQLEPADALPGDLMIFSSAKQLKSGILLNGSRVIHCSGSIRIDTLADGILQEMPARKTPWKLSEVRRIRL